MKKFNPIILLLLGGIVFGLAAFPVFAQKEEAKDVVINKRPLQDFGNFIKDKLDKGEVDLNQSFKVVLEGVLTTDGKFDKRKSKFTLAEGDAQVIEAIGDSGWFGHLQNFGAEKVKIILMQDGQSFLAKIESEQKDKTKANEM